MIMKHIGPLRYNNIIKNANNYIYHDKKTGKMIKLDKDCANEMLHHHKVSIYSSNIDDEQISYLSEKQKMVHHSYLPSGVIYYDIIPVGIIYPRYFNKFKTFKDLYNESSNLIFNNLKEAYYKNLELLNANIYNKDFAFKNIMYNNYDVELVDLDGRYIGNKNNSTYNQVYRDYLEDFYILVKKKLEILYGEDSEKALDEIKHLFMIPIYEMEIDYPLNIIKNVEKTKILK